MRALFSIAWRSAWNRRFTLALTVFSIALSTFLLLGVERIRTELRENFASSVSGTDLIVGARTGSTQLLLYSVFRIGAATNNISWKSVQALQAHPGVDWVVPLSLGDSHRGFSVLATTPEYFTHFRYGDRQTLKLREGKPFDALFDAVVGAEVADKLGYHVGQKITLAHGSGELNVAEHADKPFTVVGVLARTGTPVDRTVHIGLAAMEAIHLEWVGGAPMPGVKIPAEQVRKFDLTPKNVTAALVGLKNRAAVFGVQRWISTYTGEPLMAILPGVALDELWSVIGIGENALLLMSALVALVSLAGLVSVVMAGLNERRRELAVLRAVGAGLRHVLALLALEGALVTVLGVLLGVTMAVLGIALLSPWLQAQFGLTLSLSEPTLNEWLLTASLLVAGWLASLLPGIRAYRLSLADGLSPRI
ncbi:MULTISPECIES: FtsX-like permease family protein [Variovorax]|uniref:ABC transport system permease protein n=1 Tax=Variovorax boronicumulans TaxID=436515 RepID=A0AAW8E1S5_9BURK|nr:FtsX-like permease family protein [Variovorax boronicumulans]MDP9880558.1 putative ABC transport system permease protein [Variovorax boronicumulans]MDP9916919.1 putative ABC transport system permease protein [Variovorax boronicumulans]MDP9925845.1 putative ABC transport system permease protein [Variovorax boronicumulans]OEZ28413.1 peptide ABC transporter permease [Variovorax boronicumulans]PBI96227.1 FtsX-like permease family protein [Variovorax boronicumulans]